MNKSAAIDLTKSPKTVKKNWLFGQEAEAMPAQAVSGWNEGYAPANKFLYFAEPAATLTASDSDAKLEAHWRK